MEVSLSGLPLSSQHVMTPFSVHPVWNGRRSTWTAQGRDSDAVFAADDDSAYGAILALHALGIDMPAEVSVVGFADQHYAGMIDPPLSTVRAPTELAGRPSVMSLIAKLAGNVSDDDIVLPTQAIYRRSCGCPDINVRWGGSHVAKADVRERKPSSVMLPGTSGHQHGFERVPLPISFRNS
ncbi:MAG: substrate-binding domain-containing protein [Spirochaetes bacterium]|nr:substrate-binding domain-containing protein [Spirochaetota bacterium]